MASKRPLMERLRDLSRARDRLPALEAACARALKHSAVSWKSVQAILKNGLDLQQQDAQRTLDLPEHENLRGAAYYQSSQIH